MDKKRDRSRAYPVLDLEDASRILAERLRALGPALVERDQLAHLMGYSSGAGGVPARKIAALVHYGLLRRGSTGQYGLDRLGFEILRWQAGTHEYAEAVRSALKQPVLFRRILEHFSPQGRLPLDLARVLEEEHGITANASEDAVGVFVQSAKFAGILDADGTTFCLGSAHRPAITPQIALESEKAAGGADYRIELHLSGRKRAQLLLPPGMTREDVNMLKEAIDFEIPRLPAILGLDVPRAAPFRLRAVQEELTKALPEAGGED